MTSRPRCGRRMSKAGSSVNEGFPFGSALNPGGGRSLPKDRVDGPCDSIRPLRLSAPHSQRNESPRVPIHEFCRNTAQAIKSS